MCLEKQTGWMDSSNVVALNESLTLRQGPWGEEGMWDGSVRLHL